MNLENLYLDLVKKTLTFDLWPEPPVPMSVFNYSRAPYKKWIISILSKILSYGKMELAHSRSFSEQERNEGRLWPGYADTMIGMVRLDNIQWCIEKVIEDDIEGDLIETGVWRGGACIFMRAVLAAYGIKNRRVFAADSFEGLPKPDENRYPEDKGDIHYQHEILAVSLEQVQENFKKYDLLDDQVVFLKGWFSDTLPKAPIKNLAILRIDGDMYGSTIDALKNLYPKLSPGGFCIIDDYDLQGCRKAVEDYRAMYYISDKIHEIDWTGIYWRKEGHS